MVQQFKENSLTAATTQDTKQTTPKNNLTAATQDTKKTRQRKRRWSHVEVMCMQGLKEQEEMEKHWTETEALETPKTSTLDKTWMRTKMMFQKRKFGFMTNIATRQNALVSSTEYIAEVSSSYLP